MPFSNASAVFPSASVITLKASSATLPISGRLSMMKSTKSSIIGSMLSLKNFHNTSPTSTISSNAFSKNVFTSVFPKLSSAVITIFAVFVAEMVITMFCHLQLYVLPD